jgi:acyl-[acyl-carrier-protein]-phospholipid O-acyltransferase / long-chain-fatty-acid--[acyl-carrier-protein] ligase
MPAHSNSFGLAWKGVSRLIHKADCMTDRKPTSLTERLLRGLGMFLGRLIYRVQPRFTERLPEGGFLLLPNHLTWVDAIVLQLATPRPIRFIVFEAIYKLPLLYPIFRCVGAIPISPKGAKDAVRAAIELIEQGEVVCIFPEGELSRSGMLLRLKRGYELIARGAKCPVVPVWLDQLWGSVFSFEGGKYFFKIPRSFPYPVMVAFGEPIAYDKADIAEVRERFLELGEYCYQHREPLRGHLARACIKGLKKRQWATAIIDGMDNSKLSRGMLLAAGIALSRFLAARTGAARIAIVMPPGKGGLLANLAVLLADRIPVNLNFTAGRSALEASIEKGGIVECITADPVMKKLGEFPWPDRLVLLDKILPKLKLKILGWRVVVALLPSSLIAWLLEIPKTGDKAEALLLFTSGSSGAPKGVALTHRNLLGNVAQFGEMLGLGNKEPILGCLPFFHSFGATVTILYPLIECIPIVTYPSPLEAVKLANLIERYQIALFVSTPTFLRGFLRRVEPEQLRSLKLLVTGAEKLPQDLADAFYDKFKVRILQGYGLTETSPVAAVNLPEPKASRKGDSVQPSSRDGSVGKLAPGMAARITCPDSGERRTLHETGMLWLKGVNIFGGYLDDPVRSNEVLDDGWFRTGDLGRIDEDGFLFIEGRLSRFSKIGGEMVPHETVETRVVELLELPRDERVIAITGIPDEAKGEALVLLTTREIDSKVLRDKLSAAGVPNLWIPKTIKRVEAIPMLASGKLDLTRCKEIAMEGASS